MAGVSPPASSALLCAIFLLHLLKCVDYVVFIFAIKNSLESFDSKELLAFPAKNGGDKRDRTADLLNAIQALSQLSYTPTSAMIQALPVQRK